MKSIRKEKIRGESKNCTRYFIDEADADHQEPKPLTTALQITAGHVHTHTHTLDCVSADSSFIYVSRSQSIN